MRQPSTTTPDWGIDASPRAALGQLQSVLPVEDWSPPAADDAAFDSEFGRASLSKMARALCRQRKGQVILTGDRGVGKTTLIRRLAAEVARGEFPRLADRRFVQIDVSNVGPEDSRACLELIISSLADAGDLVICLDGLAALFPRPSGGSNKPRLRTVFQRSDLRIIGIMNDWEYAEQIGSDAQMLPLVTRVRLAEPRDEEALAITRCAAGLA